MDSCKEFVAANCEGVRVELDGGCKSPMPFGRSYVAKGFYVQGKHVIVVGEQKTGSTVRLKYGLHEAKISLILKNESLE